MNMCRRMNPASSSNLTPMQMSAQGATMTRYVERFGGFGKVRDYGQIMWQVAMIMDYMQQENWQGAKGCCSAIWQCAWSKSALDGSMDVGLLLSLAEDPPSGVFTNRSLAPLSRGKAFAPLADQRWITVALSFIRELDVISQRRSDVVGGSKSKCSRRKCNSKDKSQRTAQVNLEEEKEKPGGAGGSVILAVAQLGPGSGGGACPSDRCCPKPSRGSTGVTQELWYVQSPKSQKENKNSWLFT